MAVARKPPTVAAPSTTATATTKAAPKRSTRAAPTSAGSGSRSRTQPKSVPTSTDADELADDLGKLKIQPSRTKASSVASSSVRSRVTTASTKNASSSSSTLAPPATTVPSQHKSQAGSSRVPSASASVTSRTSTKPPASSTTSKLASTSSVKGKGKAKEQEQVNSKEASYPWTNDSDETLRPVDKVKLAMQSVNASMKSLAAAVQSGYRYGMSNSTTKATNGIPSTSTEPAEIYTDNTVEALIETCEAAFNVLRALEAQGHLGSKGIEVEKACQGIVLKCLSIGMYRQALSMLVEARPAILKLYAPSHVPATTNVPITLAPSRATPAASSRATSRTTSKSASRIVPFSSTSKKSPPNLSPEYAQLARMPLPDHESEMSEAIRGVMFSSMMASWVALVVITNGGNEILPLMAVPELCCTLNSSLWPLSLALDLPSINTVALLRHFYRQVVNLSLVSNSTAFLQLRILALMALALCISYSPDTVNSPSQLWESAHKTVKTFINADEDKTRLREAAEAVKSLVDWVDVIAQKRKQERELWYKGQGWIGLTDLWTVLGRRLDDSAIIHKVLSLMTSSTSMRNHSTAARTPEPVDVHRGALSAPVQATHNEIRNPEAEIVRICAELAKLHLTLETILSQSGQDHAMLIGNDPFSDELVTLGHAIESLPQDEASSVLIEKAMRAYERVRRGSVKVMQKSGGSMELKALTTGARLWLGEGLSLVEKVLDVTKLDQEQNRDIASNAADAVLCLVHFSTSPASALDHLNLGRAILNKGYDGDSTASLADCIRCLAAAAYNKCVAYYQEGKMADAESFCRISCDWGVQATKIAQKIGLESNVWTMVKASLPQRWELFAAISQKTGNKAQVYDAYAQSLAFQSPDAIARLVKVAASSPINQAFNPSQTTDCITRLSSLIVFNPSEAGDLSTKILEAMQAVDIPNTAIGATLERLVLAIEQGEYRRLVADIMFKLGEATLSVYDKEKYPIRRIRVMTRMMGIIVQSGQYQDRFDAFASDIDGLSTQNDLGDDVELSSYRKEYESTSLILRALHHYHVSDTPAQGVKEKSKRAIQALRAIVLPPTLASTPSPKKNFTTTTTTTRKKVPLGKTTITKAIPVRSTRGVSVSRAVSEPKAAKKVVGVGKNATVEGVATAKAMRRSSVASSLSFDDLKRLTRLLGSLATLLGLLGHDLTKIEVLKLLRAFQRNREDLVDDYVQRSAQLASDYQKLGKSSRAGLVFAQTQRTLAESKKEVSLNIRVELLLRYSEYLANTGNVEKATQVYSEAQGLQTHIETLKTGSQFVRTLDRYTAFERTALARQAMAAIAAVQDNASAAITHLQAACRIWIKTSEVICRIAAQPQTTGKDNDDDDFPSTSTRTSVIDDPFSAPSRPAGKTGADEPSKDSQAQPPSQLSHFAGKHLSSLQWHVASSLLDSLLNLANACAHRGSVKDVEYFLKQAGIVARTLKSTHIQARVGSKEAELLFRLKQYEQVEDKLQAAAIHLEGDEDGPDAIDLKKVQGDLYSRTELIEEAGEIFDNAYKEIEGLDQVFIANEAILPTPKKQALLNASTSSNKGTGMAPRKSLSKNQKEPLLPITLAYVLRQHAWLLREAGSKEECEQLLVQIRLLPSSAETKAEELLLQGRIALHEAFNTFKTDLFMSSLTESAVAMPMGNTEKRVFDRQSTRLSIQTVLFRAEEAYLSALSLVASSGKVEGIRQACLALALLRAFQTSLGHGSEDVTAAAAGVLASSSAITLQRELLEAIDGKFTDIGSDDMTWPALTPAITSNVGKGEGEDDDSDESVSEEMNLDDHDGKLRSYWEMIKTKYLKASFSSPDVDGSLSALPSDWAVISINLTDDHNTLFISRHQKDRSPLVFCLPLDRQGRREGEESDDLFSFDLALEKLEQIIQTSNEMSRNAKNIKDRAGKDQWWVERHVLDDRMKDLCENIEYVWLGAFKTILSPRDSTYKPNISIFRSRLEKIFQLALSSSTSNIKNTTCQLSKVHLDDTLLECFVHLDSKCKDEELEDFVYLVLDIYMFHGVPVALSELDIDQIAIDVRGVLEKMEAATRSNININTKNAIPTSEHIFLALDKNVQSFPWESIPILRGRAVSRIPSLSFLLDQISMREHLRPSLTHLNSTAVDDKDRRTVNSRRTFYILNPSGDLTQTQNHFKGWLEDMVKKSGWKGITGRPPTELEMAAALRDYDLVLYFGHGGAEQYIRSHKIRHLPQCATTMLWGCSSGLLKDQGDFDRNGTPWHYMLAGCPSLTANLWDVTDRDIDRLSSSVLKKLHLDTSHVPDSKSRTNTLLPLSEFSTVQAVNASREECKLKYLTGAAPVVYGLPVWLH